MPKLLWIIAAVYLVVISAVAVGITVKDKRLAVKNGAIEQSKNSRSGKKKPASGKKSASGKGGGTRQTSAGKKAGKGSAAKPVTAYRRIPEKTLLIISALGGSVAMLITMRAIRHKTQHMKFMLGIPAIIVAQCAAAVALVILF